MNDQFENNLTIEANSQEDSNDEDINNIEQSRVEAHNTETKGVENNKPELKKYRNTIYSTIILALLSHKKSNLVIVCVSCNNTIDSIVISSTIIKEVDRTHIGLEI